MEDNDELTIVLLSKAQEELSRWRVVVHVEEVHQGVVHSEFERLVLAHQEAGVRRRLVIARPSQLRDLESQYLASQSSWRGLLAAWSATGPSLGEVDWSSATVGEIPVPAIVDARPLNTKQPPPDSYLRARDAVRLRMLGSQWPINEQEFGTEEFQQLAEAYLTEYLACLKQDSEAAVWTDSIALYIVVGPQGQVSSEPAAILLSPLHPVCFAWQVRAQFVLKAALDSDKRCPLAGLLNPHNSPSIQGLPIRRGDNIDWRSFVAIGCNEPHWSILINSRDIAKGDIRKELDLVLKRLGLIAKGVTGGVTVTQAKRALDDVVRILSTRAVLRVGLVGDQPEAAAVLGLTGWVEDAFGETSDDDEPRTETRALPSSLEVYDFRPKESQPTAATLATLSEQAGERLRWFEKGPTEEAGPKLDLVIFDQIDTSNLEVITPQGGWQSRSILTAGALYRLHIREDPGAGEFIREGRIARQDNPCQGLDKLLLDAVGQFERLSLRGGASHLRFEPDQQMMARWVENATFMTATSSQLDPACFIRGSRVQPGYLWDYELPGVMGLDEEGAGYYLIASPPESMMESVKRSLSIVVDTSPDVQPVLDEISRRGIPVLKRLAAGGSQSRGEVGILLAVRLLQDAFRHPNTGTRLPVAEGDCIHMILAVDCYRDALDEVRKVLSPKESFERGDLIVFAIHRKEGAIQIKLTPLEVKFLSNENPAILSNAVGQATNLGALLQKLWAQPPLNDLWNTCGRALLAECLDQCFRVYANRSLHGMSSDERWTEWHEQTIHSVLGVPDLSSMVSVNGGRVLAFGAWPETKVRDMNGDGVEDTAVFAGPDARYLISQEGELSAAAAGAVQALAFSLPACSGHAESALRVAIWPVEDVVSEEPGEGESTSSVSQEPADDGASSEQVTAGLVVPLETRRRVRGAFDGFIGNELAVQQVTRDLLVALVESPPHLSKNLLLQGLPSSGKTELARRIARALDLPFVHLDGPSLGSRERLFQLIDAQLSQYGQHPRDIGKDAGTRLIEYPPFVVFVDEIHLVSRPVQESLLTMLEPTDRRARLSDRVAVVRKSTFLFATTRGSKLDPALRSRCTRIDLRPYELGEVAQMVRLKVSAEHAVQWEPEVYIELARLGRLVPRVAFGLAEDLWKEVLVTEHPHKTTLEHLDVVRRSKGIDENGLRPLDLEYLEILSGTGRPLGEEAIASQLGTVDRDEVVDEIEPVLRRLNFIQFGRTGRVVTQQGREYLARL